MIYAEDDNIKFDIVDERKEEILEFMQSFEPVAFAPCLDKDYLFGETLSQGSTTCLYKVYDLSWTSETVWNYKHNDISLNKEFRENVLERIDNNKWNREHDDFSVYCYKLLCYGLICKENKIATSLKLIQEFVNCNDVYWHNITNSMIDDGFINKLDTKGNKSKQDFEITESGIEYFTNDSEMQQINNFFNETIKTIFTSCAYCALDLKNNQS